jgi:transposase
MDKTLSHIYVGVDVSRDNLDIYLHPVKKEYRFPNNKEGINEFITILEPYYVDQIVCESTGGYEALMIEQLVNSNYKVWQIDPKRIKAFIVSEGINAKSDKIDAKMIALFAEQKKVKHKYRNKNDEEKQLSALYKRRLNLVDILVQEKNRLKNPLKFSIENIKQMISFLNKEIESIHGQIELLIKNNDQWFKKFNILISVPCVGKITSFALLAELPELGKVTDKEISALVGVAPYIQQSGNWKGQSKIKGDRHKLRRAIYMAVISGIRINCKISLFYARLKAVGKPTNVVLVACMRKLITTLNHMVKNEEVWRN